jgi:hypothetical protein
MVDSDLDVTRMDKILHRNEMWESAWPRLDEMLLEMQANSETSRGAEHPKRAG